MAWGTDLFTVSNLKDVWHEVVTLNDQVLNDSIDHRITVLDSRNWDITDALEDARNNNLREILYQMRLECWLAILVIAKIIEQLLHRLSETLVLWVLVELVGKELDFIEDAVGMVSVTVSKEEVATVVQLVPLIGGSVFHNIALLLQALSDVRVNLLEPVLQLGILVRITVDLVKSIKQVISRSAIGKALNQCLERSKHGLIFIDKA